MGGDESDHAMRAFRLTGLTDDRATFVRVGAYTPTLLQRLAGAGGEYGVSLANGLIYADGFNGGRLFNSSVSVIDPGGDRPMRMVGHFAAPGASCIRPLPDGRSLVGGGHTLWLVGRPAGGQSS